MLRTVTLAKTGGLKMERFALSANFTSRDLTPIALAVHAILGGLPVMMRSPDNLGVQIEEGQMRNKSALDQYSKKSSLRVK